MDGHQVPGTISARFWAWHCKRNWFHGSQAVATWQIRQMRIAWCIWFLWLVVFRWLCFRWLCTQRFKWKSFGDLRGCINIWQSRQVTRNSLGNNISFTKASGISWVTYGMSKWMVRCLKNRSILKRDIYIYTVYTYIFSPIMEVENGGLWKVTTIGGIHFSLPWLWEEGYILYIDCWRLVMHADYW